MLVAGAFNKKAASTARSRPVIGRPLTASIIFLRAVALIRPVYRQMQVSLKFSICALSRDSLAKRVAVKSAAHKGRLQVAF